MAEELDARDQALLDAIAQYPNPWEAMERAQRLRQRSAKARLRKQIEDDPPVDPEAPAPVKRMGRCNVAAGAWPNIRAFLFAVPVGPDDAPGGLLDEIRDDLLAAVAAGDDAGLMEDFWLLLKAVLRHQDYPRG